MRTPFAAVAVLAALIATLAGAPVAGAQQPAPDCQQWQDCRQLALEARARGEYERFHDLAWRAIQTGPPNDAALMYLLARAQSLSGRRRDALIMLRRLADMGVATDAATEQDLRLTRELPGWREIELAFARAGTPEPAPATASAAPLGSPSPAGAPPGAPPEAAPATSASPRAALSVEPRPVADASRFSAERFVPAGLAYDAVSRRVLVGDRLGRRLVVVGEGASRTVDLVRGDSAGFHDITALEIDTKRGDLWVTSTARGGDAGAIHKLQLISGRVIGMFDAPADSQAVSLIDLAIAANGTVLVLDSAAPRVLALRSGAQSMEPLMSLAVADPVSITAADSERIAYVAHRGGIVRLDLQTQTAAPVTAANGIVLGEFERIRWHRSSLVGVQILPDGSRGIVVLHLNRAGQAVTAATLIDTSPGDGAGPAFTSLSGDDFYYTVVADGDASATAGAGMNVLVRRVRLQ